MEHTSSKPLLTSVRVVCQLGPVVLHLPHVAESINEFVDCSVRWTLVSASRANLPHLFRRLLEFGVVDPFHGITSPRTSSGYRQWQFNEGLLYSVRNGNLELVQGLAQHFEGYRVWRSVVHQAIRLGRLEILQWLDSHKVHTDWSDCFVDDGIREQHLEVAKWLYEKTRPELASAVKYWVIIAAGNGDLPSLQWVCSLSTIANPWHGLDKAIQQCHFDVVKWILATEPIGLSTDKPLAINLDGPAANGRLDMIDWLLRYDRDACFVNGSDLEAARKGHFEIVRLLRTNKVKGYSERVLRAAAEGGHLNLVRWLCEHETPILAGFADNATDIAATNGFLDVVKWLHENTTQRATTFAMIGAAANGHLEVVRWLHQNAAESCSADAMDHAARSGHLEVVIWLHDHRGEGCTPRAMDGAASNGHLDVVKWLHTNRTEGCTTKAIDNAAANGHLAIVKWLHFHRSEGCTTDAMDFAAVNNHLNILRWLHEYRVEGCTAAAMRTTANAGHVETFQWLLAHRYVGDTADALERAVRNGHFDIVRCLYQDGQEDAFAKALRNSFRGCCCWEFMERSRISGPTQFERRVVSKLFE